MLLWVNRKVGEKKAVLVDAALDIWWVFHAPGPFLRLISDVGRLEITIWLVSSSIEMRPLFRYSSCSLFGPMCHISMNEAGKILPRRVLSTDSLLVDSSILPLLMFGQ